MGADDVTAEIARYPAELLEPGLPENADPADESPTVQLPAVPAEADPADFAGSEPPPIAPVFAVDERPRGKGPGPVF